MQILIIYASFDRAKEFDSTNEWNVGTQCPRKHLEKKNLY